MGKGERVRKAKAEQSANAESVFTQNNKKKSQTPAWVGTVAIILVAALLIGCVALSVISEGGYMLRWTTAAESDHYTVTGTMLSYYFYQSYNYFLSTYGSLVQYLGLSTGASLKNQTMQGSEQTWFDYFMSSVKSELEQMLIYCEEADKRGIKLDDEDNAEIDSAIKALEEAASKSGYSTDGYISAMYGSGVKKSDVRRALELSQLAAKASEIVAEDTKNAVTEDEINKYYDENPATFLTAGILSYAFSLEKPDADKATDDEKAEYETKLAELKKTAEELKACKTVEEFEKFVANYVAETEFDDIYTTKTEKLDPEKLPSGDALTERRNTIIKTAVENALAHKHDETASTDKDEVENAMSAVTVALTEKIDSAVHGLENDSFSYTDDKDDAEGLWVSDKERKVGDTFMTDNSSEEDEDTLTITVDMFTRAMQRNDDASRNVGHILFSTSDYADEASAEAKAKEIMEQIKNGLTKESFEKAANEYTADSSVFYYNVVPGQMVTNFNDWLFDDTRKVGDIDIVKTNYGYHIMYYLGEDAEQPVWKVNARNGVTNDKISDWLESAKTDFHITIHEAKLDKVSA